MKEKKLLKAVLFVTILLADVALLSYLYTGTFGKLQLDSAKAMQAVRDQQVTAEVYDTCAQYEQNDHGHDRYAYLFAYLYTGELAEKELTAFLTKLHKQDGRQYDRYSGYERAIWSDVEWFPVPDAIQYPKLSVAFEDSWMQSRTFGGDRVHEGCDIMAAWNKRGHYPVYSVSDGVVEQMGWLRLGGYRIGVRGKNGGYYYYAHLSDYPDNLKKGDTVSAGELLGFMGDSGYGEEEGTIGMFDVHLHFGIYLNDENGREFSVNPYGILKYYEQTKRKFLYKTE